MTGYVKVTVVLMLDAGWPVATVAETLSLDETTVYHYARAFAEVDFLDDEQLLAAHPDKARIYVVCDNARYYKKLARRAHDLALPDNRAAAPRHPEGG